MSYDKAEAVCPICEKIIWLALDYEVRDGEELHVECAKEWDAATNNGDAA